MKRNGCLYQSVYSHTQLYLTSIFSVAVSLSIVLHFYNFLIIQQKKPNEGETKNEKCVRFCCNEC